MTERARTTDAETGPAPTGTAAGAVPTGTAAGTVPTGTAAGTVPTGAAMSGAVAAAVTYYSVAPGVRLNVRSGPGTGYGIVRVLPEGARVPIHCQRPGTTVSGPYGTSAVWDGIGSGQYVSDAYVYTGSDGYVAPRCS